MATLSITRLQLAQARRIFLFLKLSHAAMKQATESAGLIVGQTVFEPPKRFWTITLWQDPKSMRRFVGSGVHLAAMPKLATICSEAVFCHVEIPDQVVPEMSQIERILQENATYANVLQPSPWQNNNQLAPVGWHIVGKFK